MSKKNLAILMRARMRPNDPTKLSLSQIPNEMPSNPHGDQSGEYIVQNPVGGNRDLGAFSNTTRGFDLVRDTMHSAIAMSKTEVLDTILDDFQEGYFSLSHEDRKKLLLVLAKEYDVNRLQVQELIKQYLGLELPGSNVAELHVSKRESLFSAFYRIERNLRHALQPTYEVLFERLNTHPGGLRFLSILRADILSTLAEENTSSLRALDSYLKERLTMWLSPATLELHQLTWNDPASLLEKIVAYEAVHPISNLLDLKRRLGVGRRCFGYLHPSIPGEPLIFIEVALMETTAQTIQEVLWDNPPIPENEATCALFYSISSTQPGLAGINLGKFLIKRVITLVKRDMPHISTFATLSPIPGFMQWLLSKLTSQSRLAESEDGSCTLTDTSLSTFSEKILLPEEERALMSISEDPSSDNNGMEILRNLLSLKNCDWATSPRILPVLKPILTRLCARYLLQEKKRGKALDSVANFHLQNGAMVERINWMADRSEKGLRQSGGIMVNYVYRLENIEEHAHSYLSSGEIRSSPNVQSYLEEPKSQE
ncbi:PREDICTED: malonyl-CoA decarboxylase, mitochondrial [Tarenaya hassleriana]|uniref:malonyl-CoA decarboxylase, mitochondrial n=1 Tax=Tarenaya hassleriana TaxID=28532 RepID=UPI00053C29F9|nr:PREDICTED: malonyl-CoA decarboxylase, mitochondrial [Tarenaya hassleriana]